MNDGSAGEIQHSHFPEPATDSPDPVRHRIIDECGPQQGEGDKGREAHAFRKGAGNESGSDHREHPLENHKGGMRDCCGIVGIGSISDAA